MNDLKFVLHIDDDPDDLFVFQEATEFLNGRLQLRQELDALTALNFLRSLSLSELPDIIIVDLNMPGLSGKEFLAILRNDPVLKNILLIAFTTSSMKSDLDYCARYGVSCFTKPSLFPQVIESVRHMIELTYSNRKQ